jgi:hypothetical protein
MARQTGTATVLQCTSDYSEVWSACAHATLPLSQPCRNIFGDEGVEWKYYR